jgi:hypothetical protein
MAEPSDKPEADFTLEEVLINDRQMYTMIANDCVLAIVGLYKQDREAALDRLAIHVPKGVGMEIGWTIQGGIKEIYWTHDRVDYWMLVTRIPAKAVATKNQEGIEFVNLH